MSVETTLLGSDRHYFGLFNAALGVFDEVYNILILVVGEFLRKNFDTWNDGWFNDNSGFHIDIDGLNVGDSDFVGCFD